MSVFPFLSAAGSFLGGAGQAAGGIASLFGGQPNNSWQARLQQDNFNRQFRFQEDSAKQGIRWRVADAQAAGISPLVALGAPTFNPSPIATNFDSSSGSSGWSGASDFGSGMSKMGQALDRAAQAGMTQEERFELAAKKAITAEHATLQNDLLRAQIAAINAKTTAQLGPPQPATGRVTVGQPIIQGQQQDVVKVEPSKVTSADSSNPGYSAIGPSNPENEWRRTSTGGYVQAPVSPGVVNSPGLGNPEYWSWAIRNRIVGRNPPPDKLLPPDSRWYWTGPFGEWRPIPKNRVIKYGSGF